MTSKSNRQPPAKSKYNFLPDLLPGEYEALKRSIDQDGPQVPSIWDDEGNLVEGWHRELACSELGIDCPREIRHFESESQKFELVLAVNCRRRQMGRKQKRQVIEAYLKVDPAINDNQLGDLIGMSKNTVAAVRGRLEATRQIDKLTEFRGRDGKTRHRKYRRIIANTPKEAAAAQAAIKNLPPSCDGKIVDVNTAARRARRHAKRQVLAAQVVEPVVDADIQLHHCRFQDLEIEPASANLVLTDIPYGEEFLPELSDLAAFAHRVLVEGGLFVTYSGQYYLPQYLTAFGQHLTYRWTTASIWDGDGTLVHPLDLTSKWKPILIYSKGPWQKRGRWPDLSHVEVKEKDRHAWQQPLEEVERLVSYFSQPGDLVVDPCAGSFTTAEACKRMGRRFVGCDVVEDCVRMGHDRLAKLAAHRMQTGAVDRLLALNSPSRKSLWQTWSTARCFGQVNDRMRSRAFALGGQEGRV